MTTRTIPTMFNPFDGAIYVTGTACGFVFGLITGNAPLTAAIASATIVGFCSIIAKLLELYIKGRHDKRISDLERELAITKGSVTFWRKQVQPK